MPANEHGDRVRNFFVQDNALQGHNPSQLVEGNWPVLGNNFWVGGQRQNDVSNSSNKNYNSQNSEGDIYRGPGSYALQATSGLNLAQSDLRPYEQPTPNGIVYGNQFHHTRQNEANFLAVDSVSDQRQLGLSVHELQQASGPNHQAKASVRSENSVAHVGFDLFGGQHQMDHQPSSMMQPLQRQLSGLNDMRQLQQQLMSRKMQEVPRHMQLQQPDLRQQSVNPVSHFAKQASGVQSTIVNGTPNSDTFQYPRTVEVGANWTIRGSPTTQGSTNGTVFPPNLGQMQQMDLGPQQVDQSLYGVPVSTSRGFTVSQYSHMMTDRFSLQQMPISSNSLQGDQLNSLPGPVNGPDEPSVPGQKLQNENIFGHASNQSSSTGMRNMGSFQQVKSMPQNALQQDFLGRQELAVRPGTLHEKQTMQVTSPGNEVALDPTEEKILFGSDDSEWASFSNITQMSGETGNLFDHGGLMSGLPSIQNGRWSALMQSAVAETSSSDFAPQEWSGLNLNNNDSPSARRPLSVHTAPSDINPSNIMGLNKFAHAFQNEPDQKLRTEKHQQFVQSTENAIKWSNCSPLQKSVADESEIYRNASHHPLEAERNKTVPTPWTPGQTRTRQQPNNWNGISPCEDMVVNNRKSDKPHNSQSSEFMVMHGEVVHKSSLWKSNSVPSSVELAHVQSAIGNTPAKRENLSLHDRTLVATPSNVGGGEEISPFVQNNYLFNHWKNANATVKSQEGETLGRMLRQVNEPNHVIHSMNNNDKEKEVGHERENSDTKENSNDSHRSNLSQHTSDGFRESVLSDASLRSLPTGKQKPCTQLTRKVSVHRKFQYHPMGNVDKEVEPTYGLKQPKHLLAESPQNTQFVQSNIFGQVTRNSTGMEKGHASELLRGNKGSEEEPSCGSIPGYAPTISVPLAQSFDSYTSNNTSSSSKNMLELLHKVDQSTDQVSFQHKRSSQLFEAEKNNGVGFLQRNGSSVSQGFGLHLGLPSQRPQTLDHSLSSQNADGAIMSLHSSHTAAEMEEKGQQMGPTPSIQLFPFSNDESWAELKTRSTDLGRTGNHNSMHTEHGKFSKAFSSGVPYLKSHPQSQHVGYASEKMSMNPQIVSSNGYTSSYPQRGSVENVRLDASVSTQHENLTSSGGMSQQNDLNYVQERMAAVTTPIKDHMQTSQHFHMPGTFQQGGASEISQNTWTNVPTHQQTLHAQFKKVSAHIQEPLQPEIMESGSAVLNSLEVIDGEDQMLKESAGQPVASRDSGPVPKMKESLEKSSSIDNCSDDPPANAASKQKDIEAFGRSLKPNSLSHQNYSLENQMQALTESGLSNRVSKRMKRPDNILDVDLVALNAGQQNDLKAVVGHSVGLDTGIASADSKMLSFSIPAKIVQRDTSLYGNMSSRDILALGKDVSQSRSSRGYTTSVSVDHPEVSPQMAPSWFNQYRTFDNRQRLPMHDACKVAPFGEPSFTLGKSSSGLDKFNLGDRGSGSPVDACQIGGSHENSTHSPVANGHFSSQSSLPNVTGQQLVILRSKKRRTATSELHPWHKDVSDGSQNHWTISVAEDWSKATNCLMEVKGDSELAEGGPPVMRSKRRLVLTIQLMQQLLPPAPAVILSADARSDYESVPYVVSRMALGDACSTVSRSSDLDVPPDDIDILSTEGKFSERNGYRRFAKVVEESIERARKLENDFSRLEKGVSLLKLKVECQDLEKFSIINRFARFHGPGQTQTVETVSMDATATSQIPFLQRYVTALPISRSLPDRVQCVSL